MVSSTTRSLFILDKYLAELPGVDPYLYDDANRSFERFKGEPLSSVAIQYYEVAIINGEGSWWAPTAVNALRFQDWPSPIVPLDAEGEGIWTQIYADSVVRPQNLYWWLPDAVISQMPVKPSINQGTISGDFPVTGPL